MHDFETDQADIFLGNALKRINLANELKVASVGLYRNFLNTKLF